MSEEVGEEKPHLLIYKSALDYFSVKPHETLFVGDNWRNDVAGPAESGMKAVPLDGVAYDVIKELPEILRLLEIDH
ncbi:HAD family hydrolase [Paenibacillus paeoniae]|uniref:HAD family hydrolase n=1 Tax=Paenibacillus paeoniae TaxID=2292705 RepID=UPI003B8323D3